MNINRTTIMAGAVVLLLALYVFAIEPLAGKRAGLQEKLQVQFTATQKYETFIRWIKSAGDEVAQAQERLAAIEGFILPPGDVSVGFAKLQIRIQDMAAGSGLKISAVKPLPAISGERYTELPIFVDCTGNITQLSDFLRKLDPSSVYISLDRINIVTLKDGKLRIKLQLSGLLPT